MLDDEPAGAATLPGERRDGAVLVVAVATRAARISSSGGCSTRRPRRISSSPLNGPAGTFSKRNSAFVCEPKEHRLPVARAHALVESALTCRSIELALGHVERVA